MTPKDGRAMLSEEETWMKVANQNGIATSGTKRLRKNLKCAEEGVWMDRSVIGWLMENAGNTSE